MHSHVTLWLEPTVTSAGVSVPFLVSCHSATSSGLVSSEGAAGPQTYLSLGVGPVRLMDGISTQPHLTLQPGDTRPLPCGCHSLAFGYY